MKCWYDGLLEVRKGEVVKITKGRIEPWQGHDLRVHVLDVVTTGKHYMSWFSCPTLTKPIIVRVVWSEVRGE